MRDVAALADVSVMTVSRVVNGMVGVSPRRKTRVLAAVQHLDYRHNLTASSLRRTDGKSATIGVVLEDVANPFSSALHRSIEDVALQRGVLVLAGSSDEDEDRERRLVAAFAARRVDGLVIVPVGSDHTYLMDERRAGTAMVFADRPPNFFDGDTVLTDNAAGVRRAIAHLVAHGHRRIGYLGDRQTIATARSRYEGYIQELTSQGIPVDERVVRLESYGSESSEYATTEMLTAEGPPTAIFAAQNMITIGACRALLRLGLNHRVALIGFDDIMLADLLDPGLTVVAQDPGAIGHAAAERARRFNAPFAMVRSSRAWAKFPGSSEFPRCISAASCTDSGREREWVRSMR